MQLDAALCMQPACLNYSTLLGTTTYCRVAAYDPAVTEQETKALQVPRPNLPSSPPSHPEPGSLNPESCNLQRLRGSEDQPKKATPSSALMPFSNICRASAPSLLYAEQNSTE